MFANWRRRRLRAQLTPLINQELPDAEAARLRVAIDADPRLAAELRRLETALTAVRALPETSLPSHFQASLAADLDLCDQPLRARYSDLLDGALPEAEAAELRRAIEAAPELAGEFAFLSRVVDVCRGLPDEPLPIGFAHSLARKLEAVDATREVAAERAPLRAPRRNLAFAGTLAVVLGCGWLATQYAPPRMATDSTPMASQPAPQPTPETGEATPPPNPDPMDEVVGNPAVNKPVAEVEQRREPAAVAPVTGRSMRSQAHAARSMRISRRIEVSAPVRPRASQPAAPASGGLGALMADQLKPVSRAPRHAIVPGQPTTRPLVTPSPAPEPERRPLTDVVIPTRLASRPMPAPSREIPSPGLLNRYASNTVALEFATASLTEASPPRATLPDLDFGGVD